MSIKVSITGLDKILKKVDAKAATINANLNQAFWTFGTQVQADAKRNAPADEGNLRNSIDLIKENLLVEVVVNSVYASYVEFGTGVYAAQYAASLPADWQAYALQFKGHAGGSFDDLVKALFEWIVRKGIRPEPKQTEQSDSYLYGKLKKDKKPKKQTIEEQQQQLAYVFAISILKKGIHAQPFLYPAFEKHKKTLLDRVKKILND